MRVTIEKRGRARPDGRCRWVVTGGDEPQVVGAILTMTTEELLAYLGARGVLIEDLQIKRGEEPRC